MTDEEILYHYIDLSESDHTQREKDEVMDLVIAHKKALSPRDEICHCPDIKVNLPVKVNDPSTFFVRPFPIAEEAKPLMDKCMQKLVALGILTNRQDYIAIMDDSLIHGLKGNHLDRLEALFKAMIKHGLKLSPKKCQLLMKHLVYMGNVFHVNGSTISITPLWSRVEAIQKLQPPTNVKGCKSFCGVMNYLSIFCRNLQKLLKPIYELTKNGRPFI